jgi:DNA-binding transcriptional LysR family regulator
MALLASQLESFLAVAAANSVSTAAKRLHLSQPAVTKQLRVLEQTLGVKLVERTPRGVRLTDAGTLLRDYGRRSAALLDECQLALGELAAGNLGRLAIGAGVTTSMFQLPRWLRSYRRQWPRVELHVRTGTSLAVADLVRGREVDCGFVTSEVKHSELVVERLYEEEIVLVVSGRLRHPARVRLERIPLIMFPERSGFRRYLERAFATSGLEAHVKMEIDSVEATKSLVAVGLGGAFLPAAAVRQELRQKLLRRLAVQGLPALHRTTTMIRRADRKPSAALANFLTVVRRLES